MRLLLLLLLFTAFSFTADAQQDSIRFSAKPAPHRDSSGGTVKRDSLNIYLNFQDIWALDLKSGTFQANFYADMNMDGDSAVRICYLNGDVVNRYRSGEIREHYEEWNDGTFRTHIHFDDYPLDVQHLEIIMEPEPGMTYDRLFLYSRDAENFFVDKPHLVGWKIKEVASKTTRFTYSNFDRNGVKTEDSYSRLIFTIAIEREHKYFYLFKLFFPSFMSMLILMIGFLLPSTNIETRFGLGVAAVFGVISSLILIQQSLPDFAGLTLIEWLNYLAVLAVFMTLIVFSLSYVKTKKGKDTRKFEKFSAILLLCCYCLATTVILVWRN